MGCGERNILTSSSDARRSRWLAVRRTEARTSCVAAPRWVRFPPPQTLRVITAGRTACSARQLVASIPGSIRNVNVAVNSVAR